MPLPPRTSARGQGPDAALAGSSSSRAAAAAAPERSPAPAAAEDREHCPQCGRVLQSHRCKLVCECGYFMSCSEF